MRLCHHTDHSNTALVLTVLCSDPPIEIHCSPTDTFRALKTKIAESEDLVEESQKLMYKGYRLDHEDEWLVSDFLKEAGDEDEPFWLFEPVAGKPKIQNKLTHEIILTFGKKEDFKRTYIPPAETIKIKLKEKSFGLVYEDIEDSDTGKRGYKVHVYTVDTNKDVTIEIEKGCEKDGRKKVKMITKDEEKYLIPREVIYTEGNDATHTQEDAGGQTGFQRFVTGAGIAGNIGRFFGGLAAFIEAVSDLISED